MEDENIWVVLISSLRKFSSLFLFFFSPLWFSAACKFWLTCEERAVLLLRLLGRLKLLLGELQREFIPEVQWIPLLSENTREIDTINPHTHTHTTKLISVFVFSRGMSCDHEKKRKQGTGLLT